jgi:hypothetical protein
VYPRSTSTRIDVPRSQSVSATIVRATLHLLSQLSGKCNRIGNICSVGPDSKRWMRNLGGLASLGPPAWTDGHEDHLYRTSWDSWGNFNYQFSIGRDLTVEFGSCHGCIIS